MIACPLHFRHPLEAQQLHGLGPKLCNRLADRLKAHCAANGLPMPQLPSKGSKRPSDDEDLGGAQLAKKPRKAKPYVPALRSGPYALIQALATLDEDASQGLTKAETVELAQPHCDSSFTSPSDPTKFFTAWNSMKSLVSRDLIEERGRPTRRYMLTEEGWNVAKRMQNIETNPLEDMETFKQDAKDTGVKTLKAISAQGTASRPAVAASTTLSKGPAFEMPIFTSSSPTPSQLQARPNSRGRTGSPLPKRVANPTPQAEAPSNALPAFTPIILPAGSFTVHLVLDTREIRTKTDRDYISSELHKRGVNPITRALPLGDALWIACPDPSHIPILATENMDDDGDFANEVMLDHIIERKRLDDLIGSIKDGRFHEQKFRLRRSDVKNVTYIIEDFSISAGNAEKYGDAVMSAIAGTQVVNGYFVKQTSKLDESIRYLAKMTRLLQKKYVGKELRIIPSRVLDGRTYGQLQTKLREEQPDHRHYITFSAFSSLCSKSDTMSLKDVFLKMLMCQRGVTGEKAIEIQKRWSTPRQFVEALEKLEAGRARDTMLSRELQHQVPRKSIAGGLSRKIAEAWG